MKRGKPKYQEKTSWSKVENQQTQPTYDHANYGNQTWGTFWWEISDLTTENMKIFLLFIGNLKIADWLVTTFMFPLISLLSLLKD